MAAPEITSASPARGAGALARGLRPVALVTIAVVVVLSVREHPAPALTGPGLAVLIALIALVASTITVVRHMSSDRAVLVSTIAMVLASATLVWVQSGGPGLAGVFVAVGVAALRLPLSASLAVLVLGSAALAAAGAHAHRSAGVVVSAELGVVAFYMLASFGRRAQEAHAQTARLLAELEASRQLGEEAATLRERSRIAREIHDVLAHSLSGLMLQLEGARMLAATGASNGQLPATLERAHHLARAGLLEARGAIAALRDEDLPGPDRLERLAAEFTADSAIETSLDIEGTPHPLDSQRSLTLFRVAQEALTNARRHAQPRLVTLQLAYEPTGTRLVVQDHGEPHAVAPVAGDAAPSASGGYGLTGMRERAELLGGSLDAAATGDGFKVELWIPS